MSWFERRQAAAQQEAQAPPPTPCVLDWPSDQRPAAKAGESSGGVSAADDAAYTAVQRAAMSAPIFDERACATRVLSCDSEKALVDILGRQMLLDLRFPAEDIEPLFSGGCWAGSVVWSASLVLCDVVAQAAAADDREDGSGRRVLPRIRGRRVLELGAGCGLPSLTAYLSGAGAVLLTEQPTVASLLQRIVAQHFPEVGAPTESTAGSTADGDACDGAGLGWIGACSLDWAKVAAAKSYSELDLARRLSVVAGAGGSGAGDGAETATSTGGTTTWDVVLISDCVYEPLYGESWRVLSEALRVILCGADGPLSPASSRRRPAAICTLERRRADGADRFLESLRAWGAEVVLERRLRLAKRWWETETTGEAEAIAGPSPERPVDNIDSDDDGDIAAMDKGSTGVIEVYVITARTTAAAAGAPGATGHSSREHRQTSGEYHSDSSDSSEDDMSLFS